MRTQYDVVIVGAGLMGTSLALWLAQHTDYSIALLERAAPLPDTLPANQRVVALGTKATNLLTELGVFDTLSEEHAYPYSSMSVWDEQSNGELHFSAADTSLPHLGHMVDSVWCNYLLQQRCLQQRCLQQRQLDCRFDCAIESFESAEFQPSANSIKITESGAVTTLQASLLVAADGANSWVRRQARIFSSRRDYQQIGIVAKIESVKSHEDCAWQRFLSSGPVAFLPLANNQCSIVWSVEQSLGEGLMAQSDEDFEVSLSHAMEQRLGAVKLKSTRHAFALKSQRAERYYKQGVVLLGDAAHAVHPLAGQGANLGFQDVVCLGDLLKSAGRERVGDSQVLARYQHRRQPDNEQTDGAMTALHSAYQNATPMWTALRGLGMNLVDRNQTLRRLLIRQAMGL
ncbi:FAD-dependent oxidoreductase [Arenicella xantha]|uniref:2-octaprenylphenol hydroxylase n=1 Tax=Arenicella xantha TaxID=644221 RepID=A0A395JID7_9GAMM|nr:FAD-dependent oxidoreductase [Arenicella xantha]RBP49633.1 2-octaprenylphenol hydroxylase [Arenicella xantha]